MKNLKLKKKKKKKKKEKKQKYINNKRHYSVPFMFLPNNTIITTSATWLIDWLLMLE
jgi:hypothetical protein